MPFSLILQMSISSEQKTQIDIDSLPIISYVFDVLVIMIMMCMLVYLSFSIVKKSQMNEKFESMEIEARKIMQKINIKNQVEIIQNGIVKFDDDSYILPARKNLNNHIYDDTIPKIKHLSSLKNDEYEDLNWNLTLNTNEQNEALANESNLGTTDKNFAINVDNVPEQENLNENNELNETDLSEIETLENQNEDLNNEPPIANETAEIKENQNQNDTENQ